MDLSFKPMMQAWCQGCLSSGHSKKGKWSESWSESRKTRQVLITEQSLLLLELVNAMNPLVIIYE